jgi:hypothetical protein
MTVSEFFYQIKTGFKGLPNRLLTIGIVLLLIGLALFALASCGGDDGVDQSGNYYWGDVVDNYTGQTLRCLFVDAGSYTVEVPTWCYEP